MNPRGSRLRGLLAIIVVDTRDSYEQVRVDRQVGDTAETYAERVKQSLLEVQRRRGIQ